VTPETPQIPETPDANGSGAPDGQVTVPPEIVEAARSARRVTVLTGAGMSAESGVPTFRDAQTGLWSNFDAEALATPEAWQADPEFVWAWYAWRAARLRDVQPNAGHVALARWDHEGDAAVRICTQNIDDLHERAGSDVLAHVHGSLLQFRCGACDTPYDGPLDLPDEPVERCEPPVCDACGEYVRPCVVWFGEMLPPDAFDRSVEACLDADLVLVVGTSGIVYPFASLPDLARGHGVTVVEINPEETELTWGVDHSWRVTAATGLPALVDAVLA